MPADGRAPRHAPAHPRHLDPRRPREDLHRLVPGDPGLTSLLEALTHVFGDADWADDELEAAEGDGLKFLTAVNARGAVASIKDKTAATAKFDELRLTGLKAPITLEKITEFLREYKLAKRTITEDPSAQAEAQMMNTFALRDSGLREIYELKSELKPPASLNDAAGIIRGILRSRKRDDEIDARALGAAFSATRRA